MEQIEELFAKLLPKYTAALHDSIFEKDGRLSEKYYQKTHHSFNMCFVGHVRKMLGLPEYFATSAEGDDKKYYCHICYMIALNIAICERLKKKDNYIYTLKEFKVHLKKEHYKDIENYGRDT